MKKLLMLASVFMIFSTTANAETVVVIDDNGYVKQQIITSNPTGYITTTSPQLTVVRENPTVNNSYYYDSSSTGNAILAGLTTAVVGSLIYSEFKHDKHHHYKPTPIRSKPIKHHNSGPKKDHGKHNSKPNKKI